MKRSLAIAITFEFLVACGKDDTEQSDASSSAKQASTQEGAAGPAPAVPANVNYTTGQTLVTLKDKAPCRETGASAGEPWELSKGAFVKFIAVEGSELRVDSGGGIECLVAPDAVEPA